MRFLRDLRARLIGFVRGTEGVSAVEFALILPLMLTLYLGGIETSQAVAVDRKVTLVARTVGDLVAQASSITTSEMSSIFDAASAVMAPYSSSGVQMVVTSVYTDANGKSTVDWSEARNATKRGTGSTISLPAGLAVKNSTVIMSEVSFDYPPPIGYMITGPIRMQDTIYLKPRITDRIKRV